MRRCRLLPRPSPRRFYLPRKRPVLDWDFGYHGNGPWRSHAYICWNCLFFSKKKTKQKKTKKSFRNRNQHQDEVGAFHEISFEQFLMVMSHFRPPTLKTTEEEKETLRREKLRCEKPPLFDTARRISGVIPVGVPQGRVDAGGIPRRVSTVAFEIPGCVRGPVGNAWRHPRDQNPRGGWGIPDETTVCLSYFRRFDWCPSTNVRKRVSKDRSGRQMSSSVPLWGVNNQATGETQQRRRTSRGGRSGPSHTFGDLIPWPLACLSQRSVRKHLQHVEMTEMEVGSFSTFLVRPKKIREQLQAKFASPVPGTSNFEKIT